MAYGEDVTVPLKALLQERRLHAYSAFVDEYVRCAKELRVPQHAPAKTQYYRWVAGHVRDLPRAYHCQVLEYMFPGWTAEELFGRRPRPDDTTPEFEGGDGGLLSEIAPAVDPTLLEGVWATGYVFEGTRRHADLSTITVVGDTLTSRNYPPAPRAEGHAAGHETDIEAALRGRHLMGQWRNINDRYYFGSLHLVLQPGECILDGYYTGFLSDAAVLAERWRWVRVDPDTTADVDLAALTVREPRELFEALTARSPSQGPIPLAEVTAQH